MEKISKKQFKRDKQYDKKAFMRQGGRVPWITRQAHVVDQNTDEALKINNEDFIDDLYVQYEGNRGEGLVPMNMTFEEYLQKSIEKLEWAVHKVRQERVNGLLNDQEAEKYYELIRVIQDYIEKQTASGKRQTYGAKLKPANKPNLINIGGVVSTPSGIVLPHGSN